MPIGRHIRTDIQSELQAQGIPCSEENKQIALIAVQKTICNLIGFTNEISSELMSAHLHSEAMVSGVIGNKLRSLKDEFE